MLEHADCNAPPVIPAWPDCPKATDRLRMFGKRDFRRASLLRMPRHALALCSQRSCTDLRLFAPICGDFEVRLSADRGQIDENSREAAKSPSFRTFLEGCRCSP